MDFLLPMLKRIVFAGLGVALLASPLISSADTAIELQAQAQALLAQVMTLKGQINTGSSTAAVCVSLARNIGPDSADANSGGDVTRLQQFLAQDFSIYPEGRVTGYFGPATTRAVQRWQAAHNLVSFGSPKTTGFGSVGPRTRAAMVQSCGTSIAGTQPVSEQQSSCPLMATPTNACSAGWQAVKNQNGCIVSYRCTTALPTTTTLPANGKLLCAFDGQLVASGSSVVAYQMQSAGYGSSCVSENRVCTNGRLSGSYEYSSCAASVGASCIFNNQSVSSGSSVIGYQSASAPAGGVCTSQTRACTNGALSGSYQYAYCFGGTLGSVTPASCIFDGSIIPNGGSRTAYESSSVPFGSVCASQTRACNNGTLSGSYTASSCAASAGSSCTLGNQSIPSGSSVTAFQSTSISAGGTCTSQIRTCTNGALSGSGAYGFTTCTVLSSNAPAPTTFIPQTYSGAGIQLHAWFATPAGQGPFPAIIIAHGCNGMNPDDPMGAWSQMNDWATLFRQWGYATLVVDSFTARGKLTGICQNSDVILAGDRVVDLYSAATVLAKMSGVNPAKIGIFGVSHGAGTVASALRNYQYVLNAKATLAAAGGTIDAGVALYTDCDFALSDPSYHSPMFMAVGAADDWTSPLRCKTLTNFPAVSGTPVDVMNFGALVRLIVYPNVTHAFDIPGSTVVHTNSFGYRIAYDPVVTANVQARIKAFFESYIR